MQPWHNNFIQIGAFGEKKVFLNNFEYVISAPECPFVFKE